MWLLKSIIIQIYPDRNNTIITHFFRVTKTWKWYFIHYFWTPIYLLHSIYRTLFETYRKFQDSLEKGVREFIYYIEILKMKCLLQREVSAREKNIVSRGQWRGVAYKVTVTLPLRVPSLRDRTAVPLPSGPSSSLPHNSATARYSARDRVSSVSRSRPRSFAVFFFFLIIHRRQPEPLSPPTRFTSFPYSLEKQRHIYRNVCISR